MQLQRWGEPRRDILGLGKETQSNPPYMRKEFSMNDTVPDRRGYMLFDEANMRFKNKENRIC